METENPLSVFESARVVTLRPGDVVLFRCPQVLSRTDHLRATAVLNEVFPGHECMVLEGGQDVAVLRPEVGWFARLLKRLRR
jgi:hypothetical protein